MKKKPESLEAVYTHTHTDSFRKIKRRKTVDKNRVIFWLLIAALMFMSIGYSAINSVTGDISGTLLRYKMECSLQMLNKQAMWMLT